MRVHHVFENDIEHADALEKTGFWGKEGAGALVFALETKRFLIGHRSPLVEQPNTWGTFGGAIDRGEHPQRAALRETEEETGLIESNIIEVKRVYTFEDKDTGFRYHNYIIVVGDEFQPVLNWENQEARWFDCYDLPTPAHFGLADLTRSAGFRNFLEKYCF